MDTFNSLCSSYDYHRLINQGAKIACPCFWTLLFCPPSLLPLRNGLYHFWFIPRFCRHRGNGDGETNSSARGRWQEVPLRICKSCRDCQNAAAISRRRTLYPLDVCNLWADQLKAGKFFNVRIPPRVTLPGTESIISWWIWHFNLDMRARARSVQTKREDPLS